MKVTIQDIADALGISRNTVSKAINNSDGLADATRERILQKAVEMGYKQFSYAAGLRQYKTSAPAAVSSDNAEPGRGGEIALFTASNFYKMNHFANLLLDRLRQELSELGYTMSFHMVDRDDISNLTLPTAFDLEGCDAIVCVEMFDYAYDEMLCGLDIPVLFVDGPHKRSGVSLPADQLYMENTTGITRLVNDMLQRGKRRIGFIGDYEHCQSFYERYTAFRCAMLMAGIPVDESLCIQANFYSDMIEPLGALAQLPELFICGNDFVAVDAIQALRKLGKSVPEDVLISGFDDAPESRFISPHLTTVHIHTQIMAYAAAHLLMTRIREPSLDFRTVYTQTDLIYRESTEG